MGDFAKAKIMLYLSADPFETRISVNDKTLPYKSIDLHISVDDGVTVRLVRNITDDGFTSEELMAHPIVEHFEASPFIVTHNRDEVPRIHLHESFLA